MEITEKRTLDSLQPGQSAVIIAVGGERAATKRRLTDMGITPGTAVSVTKIAPFGDPYELRIRGYDLSVRKEDLKHIEIGGSAPERVSRRMAYYDNRRVIPPEILARMQQFHEHELNEHHEHYDHDAHDRRSMRIALAGNPNSGKTTLFNALTGSNQYVGNWPGVTVEKKEGVAKLGAHKITIVDLPGVYSLSPYSMEEIVSRNFIIGTNESERPDAIINIIDVTNLERNLYLTVQLLELERPMLIALNFMDELRASGGTVDAAELSRFLGVPVVPISARSGENLQNLLFTAHRVMHTGYTLEPDDLYDGYTHEIHHRIDDVIHDKAFAAGIPEHWASIKMLEGDAIVERTLGLSDEEKSAVSGIVREYEESGGGLGDRETLVADSRYRYIEAAAKAALIHGGEQRNLSRSERIDRIVTHRIFAVPLFLVMMFIMFNLTFGPVGSFLSDGVGWCIESLSDVIKTALDSHVPVWLISLLTDGILTGVGGVLTFLPQIAILFFCLSILEDSGYMARAAFIMDRALRRFGLSGKAFIPMLMGFGCSVPAIMGARTMENEKDRRMTIMLIPFMSCSAKLPVYGLIAAAFFGRYAGIAIFSLYLLGMLLGIVSGLIFKKTLFRGDPAAFVMELPPYRMPKLRDTLMHIWERVRAFIIRAGTLIFIMSIILWVLQSFGKGFRMTDDPSQSIMAAIGGFIAPAFKPLGFGTWQAAVALLTGFIAKEAVVSTMAIFYGFSLTATGAEAAAALAGFTPASAFSFLVFVLLYVPCVAAMAAVYREMNSLKRTLGLAVWQIAVAWIASFVVYLIGSVII